jgi:hypothetical protein
MIGARIKRLDFRAVKMLQDDNPRSGIVDPIFTAEEFEHALKIVIFAAQKANDLNQSWWVVCSATELYATDTPPADTEDLDALYILEIPCASKRGKGLEALLKHLHRWAFRGDK